MQKVLIVFLGIAFILVMYLGQSHWSDKISEASAKADTKSTNLAKKSGLMPAKSEKKESDLLQFTKNWPAESVERLKQALADQTPFKILFVGSAAIGSENEGAYPIVEKKLLDTFGAKNIEVNVHTYSSTSTQFLKDNKQKEIAEAGADLIIFEPFILQNNGVVGMDNTLNDLTKIIGNIKAVKPETAFILQPSYPLYKAKNYPLQVAKLKDYAEQNKLPYLDHWAAWPDPNTDAMKDYLLPDQSGPSDKGVQVWGEALAAYLISK